MTFADRKPQPEVLRDIIARVVQIAHPRRLILFGSAARGEMGPDSDIDLLVVVQGPVHRRDLAGKIYRNLHGVPVAVQAKPVTATAPVEIKSGSSWRDRVFQTN